MKVLRDTNQTNFEVVVIGDEPDSHTEQKKSIITAIYVKNSVPHFFCNLRVLVRTIL